jgi:hypothetical protein
MEANPANALSGELLNRLVTLRPILEVNGAVVVRKERNRKPSYRLRYRSTVDGRSKQSALIIPPSEVDGVKRLIEAWRKEWRALEDVRFDELVSTLSPEKQLEASRIEFRKELRRTGISRSTYRRLVREQKHVIAAGIYREKMYMFCGPKRPRKPGRPRKRRLMLPGWT